MKGPVAGMVVAGKYTIERPLGRGGMGSVWLARHRDLGTPVAIKFMEGVFVASADARARFEREAKAAAHLDSMHVVQVHDYGIDDGMPYIVMELLKGEDLAGRLNREGRLSLAVIADIVTQVARALKKAHELKLVHRDLKPANIFIAEKDEMQIVKVLDFGIAKAGGPGLAGPATQTGALIGTLHYMSPEQARRSKDVDHRSDLWSIGVIVYRALTGHLPFPGDELGDVIVKICADPIPLATSLAPDLPKQVDTFMARALARKQDERFQSIGELTTALTALAGISVAGPSLTQTTPPISAPFLPPPDPRPPSSTIPVGTPPRPVVSALPPSGEELSLSEAISIRSHGAVAGAEIPSSEEISLSEVISIQSHRSVAGAEILSSEELSLSDVIVVEDKASPGQSDGDAPRPPPLPPPIEAPTRPRGDVVSPPLPIEDASLSPSFQTLYPQRRSRRLVGIVAAAAVVFMTLSLWWIFGGEHSPNVAGRPEPSLPVSNSSSFTTPTSLVSNSAGTTTPVVTTSVTTNQTSSSSAPAATISADSAPPVPPPSGSNRPREKRIILP